MDVQISIQGNDLILKCSGYVDLSSIRNLLVFDDKFQVFRTFPLHYKRVVEYLGPRYEIKDDVFDLVNEKVAFSFQPNFELREYQKKAVDAWLKNDCQGVITLPTGTGKTLVALEAINRLKLKTLIVVPTINLLEQWKQNLEKFLGVKEIGIYGGGQKEKKDITITTYDSAFIYFNDFVDFGLVVFDETHHLPSQNYRKIAQGLPTPRRMGLTATPERSDELHKMLDTLVGKEIFKLTPSELRSYISPFEIEKVYVDLSPEEREKYKILRKKYLNYCRRKGIRFFSGKDFNRLVFLSAKDPKAKEALDAHRESRKIALNAGPKIIEVDKLLVKHKEDKVVIFSEFNSIVSSISQEFFIPSITHKTNLKERRDILEKFRVGEYTKIVTSKVLDEGWDVKDANIGIVVSGTGVKRQLIQRLGRLLRKKEGKKAILYEVITKGTMETSASRRRRIRK